MNMLDMRTVIISCMVSNLICLGVMAALWRWNRGHFSGLGFWLLAFFLQFVSLPFFVLRGVIPDFFSMTVGNTLAIGGILSLYIGLEYFTGNRGWQIHNYILLVIFVIAYSYFAVILPSLAARNLLFSAGLMFIYAQCAWLMLCRVSPGLRSSTRSIGYVSIAFCLVSLGRIVVTLFVSPGDDFFHSNNYETLTLVIYQMLFIVLTFSLFLLVNDRLFASLKEADERYQNFFARSFEAIYRTEFDHPIDTSLPVETQIDQIYEYAYMAECNQALADMYNLPSADAMVGMRLQEAHGGASNPINRATFRRLIEGGYKSTNDETQEQDAHGNPVWFLSNTFGIVEKGFLVRLWGTSINITERKLAEAALVLAKQQAEESESLVRQSLEFSPVPIAVADGQGRLTFLNKQFVETYGYTLQDIQTIPQWSALAYPNSEYRATILQQWDVDVEYAIQNHVPTPLREYQVVCKTGEIKTVEISAYFEGDLAIGLFHDVSSRKFTEDTHQLRLRLWEFSTSHSAEEIMQMALDEVEKVTGSPIGFYHFLEEDENMLSRKKAWSTRTRTEFCKVDESVMHYSIRDAGVWADCFHQKKPVIHNDYASLSHRKGLPEGHAAIIREMVVPILRGVRVVAILGIGNKPSDYNERDVELVSYIADVVWTIVEYKQAEERIHQLNSQLARLAMTDELTGMANRRAFFLQGAVEIQRMLRYSTPLSLITLDIDRFKNVNDTYGHAAGDLVLERIAHVLRVNIRDVDILARLGGEEFGIILPNTRSANAIELAERLRLAVEQGNYKFQDQTIQATISVGVAEYQPEMLNIDTLLRKADTAMYRAKSDGRNRIVYLD